MILVLFSFSRKARKDYGIMAGHGRRPLTPLVYWLGTVPTPLSRSRTILHMPAPPACPHLARTCQLMTYFCLMDESRYSSVCWWKKYPFLKVLKSSNTTVLKYTITSESKNTGVLSANILKVSKVKALT